MPMDGWQGAGPYNPRIFKESDARQYILSGAMVGETTGWLPIAPFRESLMYALTSGSAQTEFSIDISADGFTSLGQAYTGVWSSSSIARVEPLRPWSDLRARYFRVTVTLGGPLSMARGA